MAAQVSVDDAATLTGNSSILFSSCAVTAALSSNAYPKQAKERGWVDLY